MSLSIYTKTVTIEEAMSSLSINEDGLKDIPIQLTTSNRAEVKRISDNQPKVEWIMERIRYLVVFYPEPTTARVRTDDQHLRRLKSYSTIESIEGSDWDLAKPTSWNRRSKSVAKYVREPVIHLAKLLIPIMKLSRLFFNKISVRGINTKRLPLFTEMCSEQIESLAMSHGSVSSSFVHILSLLDAADRAPGVVPHVHFIGSVRCLKNIFEAPLLIVLLYLVPAIPDTDGFPIQNYYKNWLITWNTQRILATENFINIFTRSSVVDPELL
ncbi:hypothetical protein PSTT_03431 [Puccinia striiformis]|uniref:Uncharacterized protein n=1 Tax=Puccinia striiformis TaxID=27350 RepID=A0A2S4VWG1_9BASI|nr:hypothetical protein PSTT_03431 [Puccinia striiformis]